MSQSIQLHTDFNVDMEREEEFLAAFANFKNIVQRAAGFIDTKLVKLRGENEHGHGEGVHPAQIGPAPPDLQYRLLQEWESEEARWAWNPSADHHAAWFPLEEPLLKGANGYLFTALLFDQRG